MNSALFAISVKFNRPSDSVKMLWFGYIRCKQLRLHLTKAHRAWERSRATLACWSGLEFSAYFTNSSD